LSRPKISAIRVVLHDFQRFVCRYVHEGADDGASNAEYESDGEGTTGIEHWSEGGESLLAPCSILRSILRNSSSHWNVHATIALLGHFSSDLHY
ncbi:hypothetical protein PFISCL1PPCAC_16549, partial [Pristionchus fissidentatus]